MAFAWHLIAFIASLSSLAAAGKTSVSMKTIYELKNGGSSNGFSANNPSSLQSFIPRTLEDLCNSTWKSLIRNCSCEDEAIILLIKHDQRLAALCTTPNATIHPNVHFLQNVGYLKFVYASLSTIMMIIGLVGNILVLMVSGSKQSLSRYQRLIVQLAVYDVFFILAHIISITPLFWTDKWVYGKVGCKVLSSLMSLGSFLSLSTTMLIAVERYLGVAYPTRYVKFERKVIIISYTNIAVCLLPLLPEAWFLQLDADKHCIYRWSSSAGRIYYSCILILFGIVPASVVPLLYFRMVRVLKNNMKKNEVRIRKDSQEHERRYRTHTRIGNILLVTTLVYILSQTPYYVTFLSFGSHTKNIPGHRHETRYTDLDALGLTPMQYMIISFGTLMAYSVHLAVNPIIYSIIDRKWRQDFKDVIRRVVVPTCCYRKEADRPRAVTFDTFETGC